MNKDFIYPKIDVNHAYLNEGMSVTYNMKLQTYVRKKHTNDRYYFCHFIKTFNLAFPERQDINLFIRDNYFLFLNEIYMFHRNGIIVPELVNSFNEPIFILDNNQ